MPARPVPPADAAPLVQIRDRFLALLLAGDRRAAVALLTGACGQGSASSAQLRTHVIRAAQEEVGRLWETNAISIAQEHMATAISQLALAELFGAESLSQRNGRRITVACVEGELHDFPARLVADELEVAGFDVRFLGADVPTDALLSFIAREPPDLVALSATMAFHASSLRNAVARLREVAPRLPIAVGGQVCASFETLGEELDVDIAGCDAATLVAEARRLLQVA